MNRLARTRLVALRDLRERLNSRAFRASTAILVVIALGAVLAPQLFGGGPTTITVGFVGEHSTTVRQAVAAAAGQSGADEVETASLDGRAVAEDRLAAGEIDLALLDSDEVLVEDRSGLDSNLATSVASTAGLVTGLQEAGVDPDTAAQGLASPPLDITAAQQSGANEARFWLVYAATFLLYGALVMYGTFIVNGVVEEKTSRVVEVVVSTVRPVELLAGKTIAMGALAIGQLLVVGVPALTLATLTDQVSLPSGSIGTFGAVLLWFVLGYAFYSTVFAAAGATATRTQDVQTVSMPVMLTLGLSFVGSYFVVLASPDGLAAQTLSYLPPTAPVAMLMRSALGAAAGWEVALSAAITLIAAAGTVMLAARIYRGSLLETGQRVSVREAWQSAQA